MSKAFPKNIETLSDGESFIIRRKWFTYSAFFYLFFSILWNGFMVVWMGLAFSDGAWLMAAFGSLHAGVGLYLIYFTTAKFLNVTDITITPERLTTQHSPLPWIGLKEIPIHRITRLYTKEHVQSGEDGDTITCRVMLLADGKKEHKLITGLDENYQAEFIKTAICGILGLEEVALADIIENPTSY